MWDSALRSTSRTFPTLLEASSHSSQLGAPTLNILSPVRLGAPVPSPVLLTCPGKAALLRAGPDLVLSDPHVW